ncbi:MAG: TonB-dependent receptor [Cyanobacteria bacterium M5B4]|nr:MAG: TonB-dependent receptor [Cyanobacteria bacterium M5B4]
MLDVGSRFGYLVFACGIFPLLVLPALAQNQQDIDLEEIELTVTEKLLRRPVTSTQRRDATLQDGTRPAYTIERQEIEQQGARTAKEALKFLPGILGGGTVGTEFNALSGQFIRGSNTAQVLILLDGRPVNNLGGGGFDLSEIPASIIERVEVIPGGGSTLYGSDAIGGIINIVTTRPTAKFTANGKLELGSYSFNEQTIQLSQKVGEFSYLAGFSRLQAQNNYAFSIPEANFSGVRVNNDGISQNANLKLTYEPTDRTKLSFTAFYLPKNQGVPGGVPIPDPPFGQGFFNSLTDNNRKFTDQVFLDLGWEQQLGEGKDSLLLVRVFNDRLNTRFDNRTEFADTLVGNPPRLQRTAQTLRRFETRQNSFGFQIQHNWKLSATQILNYGFDYRSTNAVNETTNLATSVVSPGYNATLSQGALFAQYSNDLTDRFSITGGVRQELSSLANGSITTPSVGLKYVIGDATVLRANYIRNFRTPTIANLFNANPTNIGNPNLLPEIGDSYEIGIDQKLGDIGLLRLTGFSNNISNLVAFKRITPPVDGVSGTWQNLGQVVTNGLEAALNLQIAPNLFLSANYTLNDPRILSSVNPGESGKELRFAGADKLNIGLSYENSQGWYVGLLMNSLSGFPTNNTNTEFLAGQTTFDLRLQAPINDRTYLTFGMENIFDQRFQLFPGFPDGGRTIRAGFRFQL